MEGNFTTNVPQMNVVVTANDKTGTMPSAAMLANSYVPMQRSGSTKYSEKEGIVRGTLFPGLDLPFKNKPGTKMVANNPLGEIMALDFAIQELGLYLDTHPNDQEALGLMNNYIAACKEMKRRYETEHGPLTKESYEGTHYRWVSDPWPWDYKE